MTPEFCIRKNFFDWQKAAAGGLLLALVTALPGCASVPLSTIARMSTFDEKDLASLDPGAIRVRIKEPVAFTIDPATSFLTLDLTAKAGSFTDRFNLEQVSLDRATMPGGPFSDDTPVRVYTLKLTAASQEKFHRLQALVANSKVEKFDLNIAPHLDSGPKTATSIKIWTELMLKPEQGYMVMIDGAEVPLNKKLSAKI